MTIEQCIWKEVHEVANDMAISMRENGEIIYLPIGACDICNGYIPKCTGYQPPVGEER